MTLKGVIKLLFFSNNDDLVIRQLHERRLLFVWLKIRMRINNMDCSLESIPDTDVLAIHICPQLLGFSLFLQLLG